MASYKLSAIVALLYCVPVCSIAQGEEPFRSHSDPVKIAEVTVRMSDHGPVVLLQAEGRTIPIFIDLTVALSIQNALNGEKLPRPMSHDLMHTILDAYGGKVTQTVITLKNGTYYGALTVAFKDQVKVFDSRSSDSIALAVHSKRRFLSGGSCWKQPGRFLKKKRTWSYSN